MFPALVSTLLENCLPFSSNLKLSSANSFSLEVLNLWFGKGLSKNIFNPTKQFQAFMEKKYFENILGEGGILLRRYSPFSQCYVYFRVLISL